VDPRTTAVVHPCQTRITLRASLPRGADSIPEVYYIDLHDKKYRTAVSPFNMGNLMRSSGRYAGTVHLINSPHPGY
jgi:hypothetical protein